MLHGATEGRARWSPRRIATVYLVAVGVTYLPLVLAVLVGGKPVNPSLSFFDDWNVFFMFLVVFPMLVLFILRDDAELGRALGEIKAQGALNISDESAAKLIRRWQRKFHAWNLRAQVIGVLAGTLVMSVNYDVYAKHDLGYWIVDRPPHGLLLCGYVYLSCIFLFWFTVAVYVVRVLVISTFLRALVKRSVLRMMPFHPDKAGGLGPVGKLGVRNQYLLTVVGLNIVILHAVCHRHLVDPVSKDLPDLVHGLIVAAGIFYVLIGPLVFMGPLLAFRPAMMRSKNELMGDVAIRLRAELHRLRGQLAHGALTKEDEELVERLRKVGAVADEMPVWPFDVATLRRFVGAYILPVAGAIATGHDIGKILNAVQGGFP